MAKKTVYRLPASLVPDDAKLHSGEEMAEAMVGAYYGSSYEYNISMKLQYANGKNRECPCETQLDTILKPKLKHGEFGALKSETQQVGAQQEIGRGVVELQSLEDVKAVRQHVDRLMKLNSLTDKLQYVDKEGRKLNYPQLCLRRSQHHVDNDRIQAEKNSYLASRGLLPTYIDGKKVSPSYDQAALDKLQELNNDIWTATGVNLVFTFTGIHTIAKDSKYYTGHLDQAQLDELAAKLDYKEVESFHKGVLKSATVSIPIQNVSQLKQAISWLQGLESTLVDEWPKNVTSSAIKLEKVSRSRS